MFFQIVEEYTEFLYLLKKFDTTLQKCRLGSKYEKVCFIIFLEKHDRIFFV
jgi:hypothetical protein